MSGKCAKFQSNPGLIILQVFWSPDHPRSQCEAQWHASRWHGTYTFFSAVIFLSISCLILARPVFLPDFIPLYPGLTTPMLRLLSPNAQERKDFWKPSKPCHVGIHWKALAEYSQMSTHMPGFQWFFRIFALFCIGQLSHQQHKG